MGITTHPLTVERWDDLVTLFGPERGAQGGCWCMWWRMTRTEFQKISRDSRRDAFHALVKSNLPVGLLAYDGERPVGWCAVGPRASLPRLMRSRITKPVEDDVSTVWLINCFFIDRPFRGQGLSRVLIDGAVAMAREEGGTALEACPLETDRQLMWGEGFIGLAKTFREAGFEEIARRSPTRPLMRRTL
jgi:GNAT superfamily N-acetyltransferase